LFLEILSIQVHVYDNIQVLAKEALNKKRNDQATLWSSSFGDKASHPRGGHMLINPKV